MTLPTARLAPAVTTVVGEVDGTEEPEVPAAGVAVVARVVEPAGGAETGTETELAGAPGVVLGLAPYEVVSPPPGATGVLDSTGTIGTEVVSPGA